MISLKISILFPYILALIVFKCCDAAEARTPFDMPETELTITVMPGAAECFFQAIKKDYSIELEYQVIDASFGEMEFQQELDIDFQLYSPTGQELILDYRRSEGMHRHTAIQNGDYKLCFSNSYSRFSRKTIFFEFFIYAKDDEDNPQWDDFSFAPELLYNDTVDQIKGFMNKIHQHLEGVKHYQDQMKVIETRDRNVQEHNFTRVNNFSMLFIVVMLVVGCVQVVMVRSLFEEKSRLHKVFQLLS